jgi:catechol 2,3-dioxygenase-like lactoylglutathione lyase family enzyme
LERHKGGFLASDIEWSTMNALGILGLWHLALKVRDIKRSRAFYEELFGMKVVWQPDSENVYLSSGRDNLALHQITPSDMTQYKDQRGQFLDHLGVIMESAEAVDRLFVQAEVAGHKVVHRPRQHRDGSYSFYLADPDGNTVQVLYEPTVSDRKS